MMLSHDPRRYRRRLHAMLNRYTKLYRREHGPDSALPRTSREDATKLWDTLDAHDRRQEHPAG